MTSSIENLKSLLAFGYHISMDNKTDERRLKYIKLPNTYLQSNGYKPQPLDLSNINLSTKMDELIEILAENTHNVWAEARIKDGFTYGVSDVSRDVSDQDFVVPVKLHFLAPELIPHTSRCAKTPFIFCILRILNKNEVLIYFRIQLLMILLEKSIEILQVK
jgi:hypothetical protein